MFNLELFCATMTLLCLSCFLTNNFCHFSLTNLPHRTSLKLRTSDERSFAQRELLRQSPCAMAGVIAIFISCGSLPSETYNCPSWSLSFFSGRYNSLRALSCSTFLFRASLSKASLLQFSIFILPTSYLTSSSLLNVGLPILLTEIGLHSVILFTIVPFLQY